MLRWRGSNRQWGTFWSSNLVPPKWILGHSNTEFKYCTRYWTTSTKEKETEGTLRLEIFIPLRVWKGINFSRLVSEGEMKKGIWLTPSLQSATTANRSLYLQMVNLVWVQRISDILTIGLWHFCLHVSSVSNTMLWAKANLRPHLQYNCILNQV